MGWMLSFESGRLGLRAIGDVPLKGGHDASDFVLRFVEWLNSEICRLHPDLAASGRAYCRAALTYSCRGLFRRGIYALAVETRRTGGWRPFAGGWRPSLGKFTGYVEIGRRAGAWSHLSPLVRFQDEIANWDPARRNLGPDDFAADMADMILSACSGPDSVCRIWPGPKDGSDAQYREIPLALFEGCSSRDEFKLRMAISGMWET